MSVSQQLAEIASNEKTVMYAADANLQEILCYPEVSDKPTLVQLTDACLHAQELAKHLDFGRTVSITNHYSRGSCVLQTVREKNDGTGSVVSTTIAAQDVLRNALKSNRALDKVISQL
ncbi:hypothetical protein SPOG_00708 [Schizosaccharomyces cryophilus OY26]|uniref:Uncharacterized protein n=1 Tax=Schizosaccharomyces cryophilus (strain OY26 / ATCC MYA-4695 / CBS 11777 / NBRC 106824 / NRRL Y48691) TaxID=653667 RepID=S9VS46_SCHCR|nr:uncharacterized protein SPOG_00708 [Schizosaccharomyces cryophilus OY26]EPY50753.1 hypothetical protein SPOG_00708 [Schizosaccharomyces cryophilus OY26]